MTKEKQKHTSHKSHTTHASHKSHTENKKEFVQKKKRFYTRPRNIILFIILLMGAFGAYAWLGGEKALDVNSIIAEKGELIQEVSVTGRVKPAKSVDLALEVSGKVNGIFAEVGDKVEAGKKLISLENADIVAQFKKAQAGAASSKAQLNQYQAAIESQEAKLEEYKQGTRPEEIKIAQTTVINAKKVLEDAEKNLENVKNKAQIDLKNDYDGAISALQSSVSNAKAALSTITEIQYTHFNGSDIESTQIKTAKQNAILSLLGEANGGRWQTISINAADGGTYGEVQKITINSEDKEIKEAINKTLDALQKTKLALNAIPINLKLSTTEKTSIETEKTSINTEISIVSGKKQIIAVQEASNESAIQIAETAVNNAKSALNITNDQLKLSKAGYTTEQIKAQEAQVNQAKANYAAQRAVVEQAYANIQSYQAQIDKTILKAPITGLITKMEAKIGEIVSSAGGILVSIISDKNFEIEANIPEVDVAKIKMEDIARVTLDAYGSDLEFKAKATKIDPAETIIEGVPTYKVTLQFLENNEEIKSGMTANIDIMTNKRDNVIAIPQRAVVEKEGVKYVRIFQRKMKVKTGERIEEIVEEEVKTGLRGSDGRIEIIEGINEGDEVVISVNE